MDIKTFIDKVEDKLNQMLPRDPDSKYYVTYRDDIRSIVWMMEDQTLDDGFYNRFCESLRKDMSEKADESEDEEPRYAHLKDFFILPALISVLQEIGLKSIF